MNNTAEAPRQIPAKDMEEMQRVWEGISDPVLLLLRVHLYSEHLVERFVLAKMPRGDLVVDSGSFSYAQKLTLLVGLGGVPDELVTSLRHLNKVRNACSHERHKEITHADIDLMGRPFGSKYTKLRNEHKELLTSLAAVLGWTCGALAWYVTDAERASTGTK